MSSNIREKPLAIDLYAGLGGWTEGLLAEGYYVVGFDIEQHVYGEHRYPAQLVIQDVLTLHGRQFKDAALIVASPPCQEFSYMAMPWSLAKEKQQRIAADSAEQKRLTALFDACFRIQREAIEAAGHFIPMVVENVRGAQKWVGRSRWNYGSFHLWGDVPALMPMTTKTLKGGWLSQANGASMRRDDGYKLPCNNSERRWVDRPIQRLCDATKGIPHRPAGNWTNPEENGTKQGGDWFNSSQPSISRLTGSKSLARKAASAMIAKIPLVLARHIAHSWYPRAQFEDQVIEVAA